jgi:hypothetical protein
MGLGRGPPCRSFSRHTDGRGMEQFKVKFARIMIEKVITC